MTAKWSKSPSVVSAKGTFLLFWIYSFILHIYVIILVILLLWLTAIACWVMIIFPHSHWHWCPTSCRVKAECCTVIYWVGPLQREAGRIKCSLTWKVSLGGKKYFPRLLPLTLLQRANVGSKCFHIHEWINEQPAWIVSAEPKWISTFISVAYMNGQELNRAGDLNAGQSASALNNEGSGDVWNG